ncbi:MAG: S8 family serine peptidase [Sedimentisphaerales bacterium]|nr:S8 family serine peptidase [Sedimentisphaerales bacterium]
MNRKTLLLATIFLLSCFSFTFGADDYMEGCLLVRFNSSISPSQRQQILNNAGGGTIVRSYKLVPWHLVELPEGTTVDCALSQYSTTSGIYKVEPNFKRYKTRTPNDARFGELWGMRNTGQTGGTAGADISAADAWEYTTGDSEIVVAVTDTGVDYTHQDLAANMWINTAEYSGIVGVDDDGNGYIDDIYGWDSAGADPADLTDADGDPMDTYGHGTHVSGTIGAVGNNSIGVVGVCWDVSIMAVKISPDGVGYMTLADSVAGIEYAIENGADVMNASWGGYGFSQAEYDVIQVAQDNGIIFVSSAGNESNNNDTLPAYPASFDLDNIIAVLATDDEDDISYFSNFGQTTVDIGAPGEGILSTVPYNLYEVYDGTSMASPHVAGACAFILSANPDLTYTEVKEILLDTADELSSLNGLCVSNGRLNLAAAIEQVLLDETPPSPNPAKWESWGKPKATGPHQVAMEAQTATDDSGVVEYQFQCLTNGDFNSPWQSSKLHVANSLVPGTTYEFRVRARDDSNNYTGWSKIRSATTPAGPDDPCSPFPDPAQWLINPRRLSSTSVWCIMSARPAVDESEPVEYKFEVYVNGAGSPDPALSGDWDTSEVYMTGPLSEGSYYDFRFKARDAVGNETAWSVLARLSLTPPPGIIEVPFDAPTVQDALDMANDGDTIIIHPGRYVCPPIPVEKNVIIRSTQPDNPEIVESTIIDFGVAGWGFVLTGRGSQPYCELKGLTIENLHAWYGTGGTPTYRGAKGGNGSSVERGAVTMDGGHLVENCIIQDIWLAAGNGGNGSDGNDVSWQNWPQMPLAGGNGGRGGDIMGVGIFVTGNPVGNNAIIRGTTIRDCYGYAGNGGNGGRGANAPQQATIDNAGGQGGDGGNAGSAKGIGIYSNQWAKPLIENCTIENCYAVGANGGDGGIGGDNANPGVVLDPNQWDPNLGGFDPTVVDFNHLWPVGWGEGGHGGVPGPVLGAGICLEGPGVIKDCTVSKCYALGGYGGDGGNGSATSHGGFSGGVGGLLDEWLLFYAHIELDPYLPQDNLSPKVLTARGGGIYAKDTSGVSIINCQVEDSVARGAVSGIGGLSTYGGRTRPVRNDLKEAFGGGISVDVNSVTDINDCIVSGNQIIDTNIPQPLFGQRSGPIDVFPWGYHPHADFFYQPIDHYGWGGGIFLEGCNDVDLLACEISDNDTPVGGGIAATKLTNNFYINDCTIEDNYSRYGGGMAIVDSAADVNSCIIAGNIAETSSGGGIFASDTELNLRNSVLTENASGTYGGAISLEGVLLPTSVQEITNCLIVDNEAYRAGGGVASRDDSVVILRNCTIADNATIEPSKGSGGGVNCSSTSSDSAAFVEIDSCILWNNNSANGGQIAAGDAAVADNPMATVWIHHSDSQGGSSAVYEGPSSDPWSGPWAFWGSGNITDDPEFIQANIRDPLSSYYLSHTEASQLVDSPCIDKGQGDADDLAADVGMSILSTRTDGIADTGQVDMGYHYTPEAIKKFRLTIMVKTFEDYDPNGTLRAQFLDRNPIEARLDPNSMTVPQGAVVILTAIPDEDFDVIKWDGADNAPAPGVLSNVVTMNTNKTVIIEFGPEGVYALYTEVTTGNGKLYYRDGDDWIEHPGRTFHSVNSVIDLNAVPDDSTFVTHWTDTVDDDSISRLNSVKLNKTRFVKVSFTQPRILDVPEDYQLIQTAIDEAEAGDIVMVAPGEYDKDPRYAAWFIEGKPITVTSIDPENPEIVEQTIMRVKFVILDVDRTCVIQGLTFLNMHYQDSGGFNGSTQENPSIHGTNGSPGYGGAIRLHPYYFYGSDYPPSLNDPQPGASPVIRNCIFRNTSVEGSDGGAGASGGDGGWGAWGHGGAISLGTDSNPLIENCLFEDCWAKGGEGGNGGGPGGRGGLWSQTELGSGWYWGVNGDYLEYFKYSGFGGAVFIDINSVPEIKNCQFTGNRVYGGASGTGPGLPTFHWKIPRFGGAVYCADDSAPVFTNCSFIDNEANEAGPAIWDWASWHSSGTGPTDQIHDYLSYGGAVAFEDSAMPTFIDCNFMDNRASIGGAIHSSYAMPEIYTCDFNSNSAEFGGAILCIGGSGYIEECTFGRNASTSDEGYGGAIAILGANTDIVDSQILENTAGLSGGGLYISSKDVEGNDVTSLNMVSIENCLIAKNSAGFSGGGITSSWHSYTKMDLCTIADNFLLGSGYGGGLCSSYGNYTRIKDSILWGNTALNGKQIAVRPSSRPSSVVAEFSDIQGGGVYVQPPSTGGNIWVDTGGNSFKVGSGGGVIGADDGDEPLFVSSLLGDYYLSQTATGHEGQDEDSPCVDAGSNTAYNRGMNKYTTRTDQVFDTDVVDMGFHHKLSSDVVACKFCDLRLTGFIDFEDFALFSQHWVANGCSEDNDWCGGADLDFDGQVRHNNLESFADCWLKGDMNPPLPDPPQWRIKPYSAGGGQIMMGAVIAEDGWWGRQINDGVNRIEYEFKCITDPTFNRDFNSPYCTDPNYMRAGLTVGQEYAFRFRVQDGAGRKTRWSTIAGALIEEEIIPIVPDPMTWATVPYATSPTSIAMAASQASGPGQIEYGFRYTGGAVITWQPGRTFEDTGLNVNTTYSYQCAARDPVSGRMTAWSVAAEATTSDDVTPPDDEPPITQAGPYAGTTKADFAVPPQEGSDTTGYYHFMTAETATDATPPVWYKFTCHSDSRFSSGWQQNPYYSVYVSTFVSRASWIWTVQTRDSVEPTANVGIPSNKYDCRGNMVPYP